MAGPAMKKQKTTENEKEAVVVVAKERQEEVHQKDEQPKEVEDAKKSTSAESVKVTLTVLNSVDGCNLLGPEQFDVSTKVSQVVERLLSERPGGENASIVHGDRKLDGGSILQDIEHTGFIQLSAVFQQEKISINYGKYERSNTYSFRVVPGASFDEFKAEAGRNGSKLVKTKGKGYGGMCQSYHKSDHPAEAKALDKFLADADEVWEFSYTTGFSSGTQYKSAFVKGHRLIDNFSYSFD
jgi:hypothetical protein